MKLGMAIDLVMTKRRMTQDRLAELTGLSQTSISAIVCNYKEPRASNLKKICEALNVSESHLKLFSLTAEDVPEHKRELFTVLEKPLKELLCSLL